MRIEYYHASKFGNGAKVAEEFERQASAIGATVSIHHIRKANPKNLPPANLYVFSSPGRYGKPIKTVRRFLGELTLPVGTRYAIFTTEMAPKPNKKTGLIPTEEERSKYQKVRPMMNQALEASGLKKVAEGHVLVTNTKGPLKEGWEDEVRAFVRELFASSPELRDREHIASVGGEGSDRVAIGSTDRPVRGLPFRMMWDERP